MMKAQILSTATDAFAPQPSASKKTLLNARADFPALQQKIHGKKLVYLDSAASALKPQPVMDKLIDFYTKDYANINRGVHTLSQRASAAFDDARKKVAQFINAPSANGIIFTRNATESINLIAATYGRAQLQAGDEILITLLEHHANIVPWQLLAAEKGVVLKVAPIEADGSVRAETIAAHITPRTRLISMAHVSNTLGTILPVAEISKLAKQQGIPLLLDGCQAVCHMPVDVQEIGCDFYVFSGHKLYGPSGIGVLWGKEDLLNSLPPYQGGGGMIESVSFSGTHYKKAPERFEAGTPAIAEAIGLAAAIEYISDIGLDEIHAHTERLREKAEAALDLMPGLKRYGHAENRCGMVCFSLDGIHAHDIGTILDQYGIAVRVGHHCAQPLMAHLGVASTLRASFGLYNHEEDIEAMLAGLRKARELFA